MVRRIALLVPLAALLFGVSACTNKHVQNPIENLGSKQPDKVLFDRAMDSMKHNKFDTARMLLQTLINAYPDSEFIARAKLATGDSWYAEGGSTAMAQAESEYRDFITFFPNMPEAAEAQMKIANIHYRQMEKPDRDFTHARRAEEEYRNMILQYPDSKLVPEASQRLREVQEVLAERQFLIGRFYYLRESYAAAMARLQTVADTYPLFSGSDEALYMLGQSYERQYEAIKSSKDATAAQKERIGKVFTDKAAEMYARIITRYPMMARVEDAKRRLTALGYEVPVASEEAIAQNKAEEASRSTTGTVSRLSGMFRRGPDLAQAAKVGEPTLNQPKETDAPNIVKQTSVDLYKAAIAATGGTESKEVKADVAGKEGAPPPSQAIPRSDTPSAAGTEAAPTGTPPSTGAPPPTKMPEKDTGIPELPVTAPTEANATTTPPAAAPAQVNEATKPAQPVAQVPAKIDTKAADKDKNEKKDDKKKDESSSKKKKKKLGIF